MNVFMILVSFACDTLALVQDWETKWNAPLGYQWELFSMAFFGSDICLNFNVQYFDTDAGQLVSDRRCIALHYIKSFFFLDVLTSFPWLRLVSLMGSGDGSMNGSLRVLKVLKMYKIVRILKFGR